jgi:hypothetical protein
MKYAVLFLVLGPALIAEAVICRGLYWLLVWPGVSLTLVGLAYLRLGPGVFGKKPDGTLAWYSVLLLLPYLLAAWVVWQVLALGKAQLQFVHRMGDQVLAVREHVSRPRSADLTSGNLVLRDE